MIASYEEQIQAKQIRVETLDADYELLRAELERKDYELLDSAFRSKSFIAQLYAKQVLPQRPRFCPPRSLAT